MTTVASKISKADRDTNRAVEIGMTKRDIVPNINFFMNVPILPTGELAIVDGISRPRDYVEMIAQMDVLCVISNCPQVNNPCNDFNPTPVQVLIRDAPKF